VRHRRQSEGQGGVLLVSMDIRRYKGDASATYAAECAFVGFVGFRGCQLGVGNIEDQGVQWLDKGHAACYVCAHVLQVNLHLPCLGVAVV
jgi:hypothetical protein